MIASCSLLQGRRAMDAIPQFNLIQDWKWDDKLSKWYIRFAVSLALKNIDNTSYWVALTGDDYPASGIAVYPDYELGIKNTYPHQLNNGLSWSAPLFKSGKVCLEGSMDQFYHNNLNEHEKLVWYVKKLISWIEAADQNDLVRPGENFEAPDLNAYQKGMLIYNEDCISQEIRSYNDAQFGFVEISHCKDNTHVVSKFVDANDLLVLDVPWGQYFQELISNSRISIGAWIMLPGPPVLNVWQSPNTYVELRNAFQIQNMSFNGIIRKLLNRMRDGKRHYLLIGYPASKKLGEDPDSIIWQAALLPVLSNRGNAVKGFRQNEVGWWFRDINYVFERNPIIDWILAENWSSTNILTRGSIGRIPNKKVLVIGAGSLGSMIAEMLVRSGIERMTVIDDDIFHAGNLSRHYLDMDSLGLQKAQETARRLNRINPHAEVDYENIRFNSLFSRKLQSYDVVFDCTGNNDVLKVLSELKNDLWLCSASFSFNVNRIFLYLGKLADFGQEAFDHKFGRLIKQEIQKYDLSQLPWEGIGCWSPVFPATYNDVSMAASIVVSSFCTKYALDDNSPVYAIYSKKLENNGTLSGVYQIDADI